MNKKVTFHEFAEFELNDAIVFFETEQEGLGLRFLSAVKAAVAHIREHPESSPIIIHDVRRKVLRDFLTTSCTPSSQIGFESLL